jgi:hypothetical protein
VSQLRQGGVVQGRVLDQADVQHVACTPSDRTPGPCTVVRGRVLDVAAARAAVSGAHERLRMKVPVGRFTDAMVPPCPVR